MSYFKPFLKHTTSSLCLALSLGLTARAEVPVTTLEYNPNNPAKIIQAACRNVPYLKRVWNGKKYVNQWATRRICTNTTRAPVITKPPVGPRDIPHTSSASSALNAARADLKTAENYTKHPNRNFNMAAMYRRAAIEKYLLAGSKGSSIALRELGVLHYYAKGTSRFNSNRRTSNDYRQALQAWVGAATLGDATSMYYVGKSIYLDGKVNITGQGTAEWQKELARSWLLMASNNGFKTADAYLRKHFPDMLEEA